MGRTSIVLDDKLVKAYEIVTGIKTPQALIRHVLEERLRHHRQKEILDLKGSVRREGNLQHSRKGRA